MAYASEFKALFSNETKVIGADELQKKATQTSSEESTSWNPVKFNTHSPLLLYLCVKPRCSRRDVKPIHAAVVTSGKCAEWPDTSAHV